MNVWVWPFSWYVRIRQLESANVALNEQNRILGRENKDLEAKLMAESIANFGVATGYATMMEGMIKQHAADLKRVADWNRQDQEFERVRHHLRGSHE